MTLASSTLASATMTTATTRNNTPRPSLKELQRIASQGRLDALEMIFDAQSGHPGTSLSCMDILTALWFGHMRHDVNNLDWADRDRCVLSKGHGAPALYAVLLAAGYIPAEHKLTLRKIHSKLQGHPASRYVAGVDVSTGSLGQGLSCAVGMALGHRLNNSNARVYAILGDGECQEGNIWEAAMSAAHHKTSRLTAIIDRNNLQIDGNTEDVKALGDVGAKFEAFGWHVLHANGNNFESLLAALDETEALAASQSKPTAIIAATTKGKGVSFMENQAGWHGKAPNADQYAQAKQELEVLLATFA
ncbi:MAG: transketolase [Vampirovibrionales bacterium]|nr:transketolase [Vampirovibrionales bacterium]